MSGNDEHKEDDGPCPHCEKIDSAVMAMGCIFDMFIPNHIDGLIAMSAFVGESFYKIFDESELEGVMKTFNDQVRDAYRREKEREALESVETSDRQKGH